MRTLQWTFVATFLYFEIFVIVLLLLPFISPSRWQKVFKSRILRNIESHAHLYFNILMVILVILFIDAIREVRLYSVEIDPKDLLTNPHAETLVHMKLYRAQRNFYISGFALFLFLVIKRLVVLIATTAQLSASNEAAMKQAKSASDAAKRLMEDKDNSENSARDEKKKSSAALTGAVDNVVALNETKKELDKSLLELEKTREELHHARLDLDSMKKQAESINKEYDRLAEEHTKVTKRLSILEGADSGSKKDD